MSDQGPNSTTPTTQSTNGNTAAATHQTRDSLNTHLSNPISYKNSYNPRHSAKPSPNVNLSRHDSSPSKVHQNLERENSAITPNSIKRRDQTSQRSERPNSMAIDKQFNKMLKIKSSNSSGNKLYDRGSVGDSDNIKRINSYYGSPGSNNNSHASNLRAGFWLVLMKKRNVLPTFVLSDQKHSLPPDHTPSPTKSRASSQASATSHSSKHFSSNFGKRVLAAKRFFEKAPKWIGSSSSNNNHSMNGSKNSSTSDYNRNFSVLDKG